MRIGVSHRILLIGFGLLTGLAFGITGCGDLFPPPETGSLTVQVAWSGGTVPTNVQSLVFTISGHGIDAATQTFEPTKSQIEITNLATGGKAVVLEGKNSVGTTLYSGSGNAGIDKDATASITVTLRPTSSIPSAPTGLTATAGIAAVSLNWTAVSGAVSYNVYRATSSGPLSTKTRITTGITTVSYTDTGLTNGTTYYYQVTTANSLYESAGSNEVSATPTSTPAPWAVTTAASNVTGTSATLNGSVNPNGFATDAYFEYGTTISYGSTTTSQSIGSGTTAVSVTANLTGLSAGTTYHFRLVASNTNGTSYGADQSFTQSPVPVLEVTPSSLSFNATVNGTSSSSQTISIRNAGAGTLSWSISVSSSSTWLSVDSYSGTSTGETNTVTFSVYPYDLTQGTYNGSLTITATGATGSPQTIPVSLTIAPGATLPATNITDTSATLNGEYNTTAGQTTTLYFEYGTTTGYGSTTPGTAYATAGLTSINYSLTGLTGTTTYHYRIVATYSTGTFYGNDVAFTTLTTPTTLVSGISLSCYSSGCIDVIGGTLYFADYDSSTFAYRIRSISTNGGAANTLATVTNQVTSLKVDATNTNIYWVEVVCCHIYTINSIPVTGGTASTIASGLTSIGKILVDSTSVYYLSTNSVNKVSISGDSVVVLATGLSDVSSSSALDSNYVYWSDSGGIKRVGIGGGLVTVLNTSSSSSIAVDSTSIYFSPYSSVSKMGLDGGNATQLTSGDTCCDFSGLVVDSSNVYWYAVVGNVSKVSINGGDIVPLVSFGSPNYNIYGIAIDSTTLYWLDASGAIKKVPK